MKPSGIHIGADYRVTDMEEPSPADDPHQLYKTAQSLKNFFRQPKSPTKSRDSSSEKLQLPPHSHLVAQNRVSIVSTSSHLPHRLKGLLRPIYTRSTSTISNHSIIFANENIAMNPSLIHETKPVEKADFADSDSSVGSPRLVDYDSESIHSLVSDRRRKSRFVEDFNSSLDPFHDRNEIAEEEKNRTTRNSAGDLLTSQSFYDARQSSQGSKSLSSGSMLGYGKRGLKSLEERKSKALSTSSNIDADRWMTMKFEEAEAEGRWKPDQQQVKESETLAVSEEPLHSRNIDTTAKSGETILKNTSWQNRISKEGTESFSLSSGELLNTLMSAHPQANKKADVKLVQVSDSGNENQVTRLSDGSDLSNFKETVKSTTPPSITTPALFTNPIQPPASTTEQNSETRQILEQGIEDFRRSHPSQQSFGEIIASPENGVLRDSLERATSHERMLSEKSPINFKHPMAGSNYKIKRNRGSFSWFRYAVLMVAGLVAPPVYFLLAMGSFDDHFRPTPYYTGYISESEKPVPRRYTKAQKLASVLLGLLWCIIVFAMIGVGVGLGLTRER